VTLGVHHTVPQGSPGNFQFAGILFPQVIEYKSYKAAFEAKKGRKKGLFCASVRTGTQVHGDFFREDGGGVLFPEGSSSTSRVDF
jgi:hypothetical protein